MTMSCNVMPLKKYAEISYRVKCVAVENERVFGDFYVTQQTRNLMVREPNSPDAQIPPVMYRKRRRNLIHQTLEGPDFMQMNSKRPSSEGAGVAASSRWQRRSKSMGDRPSVIEFNYEHDVAVRKPKVNVRERRANDARLIDPWASESLLPAADMRGLGALQRTSLFAPI